MAYPSITERSKPQLTPSPLWYPAALAVITVLSFVLRFVGLAGYPGLIYDEYYYVPAADVLLRHHPIATVKNMIPGIDPNLLSHPPVAKELMAAAIFLFGQHPLVWRLPAAVLGGLVPLLAAGIAWELFHRRTIAVFAAGLASVDGLSIVMSRVALPDAPAVTFLLAGIWVMVSITNRLKQGQTVRFAPFLAGAILLGLGLASEWIGAQAILFSWVWFLVASKEARWAYRRWVPATTVVPFLVYYASYFYAWGSGYHESWLPRNPFIAFFKLQWLMFKDMWHLTFFHPWTANAWTWLGIPRPTAMLLSLHTHQSIRMMAFSDPAVVWLGLASLLAGIWWVRRHRQWLLPWAFLGLWFLTFYATWLSTPRSKFLYYFTTASIGLDIAVAAAVVVAWETAQAEPARQWVRGGLVVLGGCLVLTIAYVMPLWVGIAMPRPFYHALWWPAGWNARVKGTAASSTQSFSLTMNPRVTTVQAWGGAGLTLASAAVPSPWTTLRGAASHNSAYADAGLVLKKSYAMKLANAGLVEAPAVAGTTAFVGTDNNQVYAVNLADGSVVWAVGVPNMVRTTPVVDHGLVVVGLGNNAFRNFSQKIGWIRGTGTNGLMAFNAQTGTERWFHETQGGIMATPVVQDGVVYDVTGASRLVAINLSTGKLMWSRRLGGFDSMSSPIIVGHHLYVATNAYFSSYPARRSTVWSINLDTHRITWAKRLPVASGLSDCSIATNGQTLFVGGVPAVSDHGEGHVLSQRLFALNRSNGRVIWSHSLGKGTVPALDQEEVGIPLAAGNVVYEGSPASGRLMAFNARSGHVLWRRRFAGGITANPVLVGTQLLVARMNGRIMELNAVSGATIGEDPHHFGAIGPAAPLVVSNGLIQSTLTGQLVVQQVGH